MSVHFLRFLVFSAAVMATVAHAGGPPDPGNDIGAYLRETLATACTETVPAPRGVGWRLGDAVLVAEAEGTVRGGPGRLSRIFRLPGGDELRMELIHPGGRLRRVSADYYEAAPNGTLRPAITAFAGGDCRILQGRQIVYGRNGRADLVLLAGDLKTVEYREPYDAPVPPGRDPGGVTVAHVDSGINYTVPVLAARLARNPRGRALGYDFWDLDERPFDGDTGRSPFFPLRHGTRTASILVREAPGARLLPYRYPRPDMTRMATLIEDAALHHVRLVNLSLVSRDFARWAAYHAAARRHPEILFVVAAGNNQRDLDQVPMYPAALPLANQITVTGATDDGRLMRKANWGRRSVDLMVPAEGLLVTGFEGVRERVSGSSYATARVTALAACLLAASPSWGADELKAALLARAIQSADSEMVAHGFLASSAIEERGACPAQVAKSGL